MSITYIYIIDKLSGFVTYVSQNGLDFWLLKVIDSYIIHVCIICAKFDGDTPKHLFYSMLIKLIPNFNKCAKVVLYYMKDADTSLWNSVNIHVSLGITWIAYDKQK